MMTIEHSVVINRPVQEVFAFIANVENNAQWQSGVLEVRKTSQGPVGVGSTGIEVRRFMGRRMEVTFEVTEYEENTKFGFKITSGPIMPMTGADMFEAAEGGTKLTRVIEAEPGRFFRMAELILARMARRQAEADMANLKDLLEYQA